MPFIKVDTQGVSSLCSIVDSAKSKNADCYSQLRIVKNNLDWQVKVRENINNELTSLQRRISRQEDKLESYIRILQGVSNNFADKDRDLSREAGNLVYDMKECNYSLIQNKVNEVLDGIEIEEINRLFSVVSGGNVPILLFGFLESIKTGFENPNRGEIPEIDVDEKFLSWLKSILKVMDEKGMSDTAGVAGDGVSYLESLYQFFTGDMKGLIGAADWFDLCDNSVGLWKGFYDYLKNFYQGIGNIFSNKNQTRVAGLDVAANILGLFSSVFGAADTIRNTENMGAAGITGQIIGVGDDIVDIWSSALNLKHIGDKAANITTKDGVFSPLSLYAATIKSCLSAISQGFTSYEKYAADGVWDLGDTAATGIESSVSGLYSIVNTLISTVTFGFVSGKTLGISADNISGGLENWSGDIGTRAGNYIKTDEKLYEEYQNANGVKKAVLIFYAAFKS